eukprot:767497-Prymnesium_polylepis.1
MLVGIPACVARLGGVVTGVAAPVDGGRVRDSGNHTDNAEEKDKGVRRLEVVHAGRCSGLKVANHGERSQHFASKRDVLPGFACGSKSAEKLGLGFPVGR